MTAPRRPESVPASAAFNADSAQWELFERDAQGRLHGAFATFHADGALITRGTHVDGMLEGIVFRFNDGVPGSDALRACCVPPGARELRSRYRKGRVVEEVFYDERTRPLCDDGTPWPDRCGDVPADASYDEISKRFVTRLERPDGSSTRYYFTIEGKLDVEIDVNAGRALAHRRYRPDGTLREETPVDEDGARHGPYLARGADYADARIVETLGQHDHGQPIGTWELRDAAGTLVQRVHYGSELVPEDAALIAGREPDVAVDAEALWQRAERASESPRIAVALAARALAKSRDLARYTRFMDARRAALRPDVGVPRADELALAKGATTSSLLAGVLAGAAPAVLFRTLASSLPGDAPAALAYFDASVLLAPTQAMVGTGRALLCVEHGEPDAALVAATLAAQDSPEAAESLRAFARVTYGDFGFRPAAEGVTAPSEELVEVEASQPLDAVERTLEVYATRVLTLRRELERRAHGSPAWLPPDTRALLPNGPRELRHYTARIEDEGDNGSEITAVDVDETLVLERSTRRLLTTAHADWAALGWLCWASGLDRVARPERLVPRQDFGAAAHQATVRCWRAHDRMRMSGLVALARGIESFEWEGMAIDAVPPHLIEVAAAEYLEVRALFFWLLFPQNESPFQRDLRRA